MNRGYDDQNYGQHVGKTIGVTNQSRDEHEEEQTTGLITNKICVKLDVWPTR